MPTAIASPTSEKPLIADWETLDSYHLQLKMRLASSDATSQFIQWKVDYKLSKQSSAAHLVISMDGPGLPRIASPVRIESIMIGTTVWSKIENEWTQQEYVQVPSLRGNWEGLEKNFRRLQFAGEETLNGILCKRYLVDEYMTSGMDFLSQRIKMTTHAQGDLWIADQSDLPAVAISLRLHMQTKGLYSMLPSANKFQSEMLEQSALIYDVEYDVTDINAPITINPPAGFRRPRVVMTATPLPGNSAQPGSTLRPTSTPSPDQIRRQMTALLWEDGAQGEVNLFDYYLNPSTGGLILVIRARCINAPCDANFMASVLKALASVMKSGVNFEATIEVLDFVIYDTQMKEKGYLMATWQDVVDFAHGRITFEKLTRKAFGYRIE
jgi:hypothetical protein